MPSQQAVLSVPVTYRFFPPSLRPTQVTRYLRTRGLGVVTNVEGGIEAWSTRIDPKVPRY